MWDQHFDLYHFQPPGFTLTPQKGCRIVGNNFTLEFRPNGGRLEQNFVLTITGKSRVGLQLVQFPTYNPQNCRLQPPTQITVKWWQMEQVFEFIGIVKSLSRCSHSRSSCNCTKIFNGFALCLLTKKFVQHIGGLSPTICGLFLFINHFFLIAAKGWIKQMLGSYNIRKLNHIFIYPLMQYVTFGFFPASRQDLMPIFG